MRIVDVRLSIRLRSFITLTLALTCVPALSACKAPGPRGVEAVGRPERSAAGRTSPVDGLIAAERGAMAVDDQQRGQSVLRIEAEAAPRLDSPLYRPPTRRP